MVIEVNPTREASVLEAIQASHQVKTAFVCRSDNDIECIDSLCNDRSRHTYWTISINGDYLHSNSESRVSPDDKLILRYASLEER